MSRMDEILARIGTIPPLPGTVLRLIRVINDPASTVQDMVEVIRYDPAVTAEMLRLCNSAFFGLPREITSLHEAVRFLGTMKVLHLIMMVHGGAMLSRGQRGYGLEPGALWTHCVGVALCSAAFARQTQQANPNIAFTAGLLHDIGKIVLNEFVGAEFERIIQRVEETRASFLDAEYEILGCSHDEIGARLAETWQLPETIVCCIRHHHNPGSLDPADPMVDMVYLGDVVCTMLGIGTGIDGLCYRADLSVVDRHGLHEADLERIGAQTAEELLKVGRLFAEVFPGAREEVISTAGVEAH
ncbi:MAG: hypothetical protein AMXMBFR13_19940 [Phycisphaerae bacterium]